MPTFGHNLKVDIYRMTERTDNAGGGATVTGTVVFQSVSAALSPNRPSQASLEQGLETRAVYDFSASAAKVTLFERDEVKVVFPQDHQLYNQTFRITGVQYPRGRKKYGMLHATAERTRESRSTDF